MNLREFLFSLAALLAFSCAKAPEPAVKPITGTWVNLAWKDVRNKYTNPQGTDMLDPALWRAKVDEWYGMGLEYLILMEVANFGEAYYPSGIMPRVYPEGQESPVDAILSQAALHGMHVFLSTGWACDQDDDIRLEPIRKRQQEIMEELAALYKDSPAFYGWYLPVEDCITPVFPRSAVEAVNRLVDRARELTPGKKTLISPYGMVYAEYDNPALAENIRSLKVDIIAYQDEVGCLREPYPLRRLRENWKKLRAIHDGTSIQMWANCETFTWEGNTNDRTSALIPASYYRLLAQQAAASEGGVERIVSFMFGGIIENPASEYPLGAGDMSTALFNDYMSWKSGSVTWKMVEASYLGSLSWIPASCSLPVLTDGILADEQPGPGWQLFGPGHDTLTVRFGKTAIDRIAIRFLDSAKDGIMPPDDLSVYSGDTLLNEFRYTPSANNRHDAWVQTAIFQLDGAQTDNLFFVYGSGHPFCIDEIILNPTY